MYKQKYKLDQLIEGYQNGSHQQLAMFMCAGCDETVVEMMNSDPGSVEEAIGVRGDLCKECWDHIQECEDGKFQEGIWETEVLESYRTFKGLKPFEEMREEYWNWENHHSDLGVTWDEYREGKRGFQEEGESLSEEEVAWMMYQSGEGTLPFDLLSLKEQDYENYKNDVMREL